MYKFTCYFWSLPRKRKLGCFYDVGPRDPQILYKIYSDFKLKSPLSRIHIDYSTEHLIFVFWNFWIYQPYRHFVYRTVWSDFFTEDKFTYFQLPIKQHDLTDSMVLFEAFVLIGTSKKYKFTSSGVGWRSKTEWFGGLP